MTRIISFYNNLIKILSQFLFKISSLHWSVYLFLSLFWVIIINILYFIDKGVLYITTNDLFQISWSLIFYILFVISLIKTRAKTSKVKWKDKPVWKKIATFTGVTFGALTIFLITTITMNATVYKNSSGFGGTSLANLQKVNNCSGDNFDIYYSEYSTDYGGAPLKLQYYKVYPKNIPIWITEYKIVERIEDGIGKKKKMLFGSDDEMLRSCPLN